MTRTTGPPTTRIRNQPTSLRGVECTPFNSLFQIKPASKI